LELERAVPPPEAPFYLDVDSAHELRAELLSSLAREERNRVAAEALGLYYRLAEAEQSKQAIHEGIAALEEGIADRDELARRGLPLSPETANLERERADLIEKEWQAELGAVQTDLGLKGLLGFPIRTEDWRIWPLEPWDSVSELPNRDEAVAQAIATRTETAILERLSSGVTESELSVIRDVLSRFERSLGSAAAELARCLPRIQKRCDPCSAPAREAAVRRRQLAELHRVQQERVAAEVLLAIETLEARTAQLEAARFKVQFHEGVLGRHQSRLPTGGSTAFDVLTARLNLIQSNQGLFSQRIAVQLAVVELLEAQGVLADACGEQSDGT
jgi:hypothetical protein